MSRTPSRPAMYVRDIIVRVFGSQGPNYIAPLTNNGFLWNDIAVDKDPAGNLLFTLGVIGRPNHVRGVVNDGVMVIHLGRATIVNAFAPGNRQQSWPNLRYQQGQGNAWFLSTFLTGPMVNSGPDPVQARHGIGVRLRIRQRRVAG